MIDLGDGVRRISNSEVTTFLHCERKYYYQFDLNLTPKRLSAPLSRGIIGHTALEHYYKALQGGDTHEQAQRPAMEYLMATFQADSNTQETVMEVRSLLNGYWALYNGDRDWKIVGVETGYDLPLTDTFNFTMRLDLLVEDRQGATVLVDHKFVYDFWTSDKNRLSPQFPKYIGALAANGIQIDYTVLNQIRYRKIKNPSIDQLFQRTKMPVDKVKTQNLLVEHIRAGEKVVAHRAGDVTQAVRSLNPMSCKGCSYIDLCIPELEGADISTAIRVDFQQNTSYGYNATPDPMDDL